MTPMPNEPKLVPCPFCGSEVQLLAIAGNRTKPWYEVDLSTVTKDSDDVCFVHCESCNANWHKEVRAESFPLDTIGAWNRRNPDGAK